MIKSLKINNFRGFESSELKSLKRVNIIVGRNGSGKTALLESLFFLGGLSSELILRLKGWRILPDVQIAMNVETLDNLFGDYFFDFDTKKTITLETKGALTETRRVNIYFDREHLTGIEVGESIEESILLPTLHFEGFYEGTKEFHVQAELRDGKLKLPRFPAGIRAAFFPSSMKYNPQETADRFSKLDETGELDDVLSVFSEIFPFVYDLSIVTKNGMGMIWCRVEGQRRKRPITLVSEGVNKLLSILLGIKAAPYSIILIDEVENGFYYETLPEICRAFYTLARKCNVQLFITTHSKELLQAMASASANQESDFSLIRTDRVGNRCDMTEFSGLTLKRAIDQNAEIR